MLQFVRLPAGATVSIRTVGCLHIRLCQGGQVADDGKTINFFVEAPNQNEILIGADVLPKFNLLQNRLYNASLHLNRILEVKLTSNPWVQCLAF